MKRGIAKILAWYAAFLLLFTGQKLLFLCVYHTTIGATAADWLRVTGHGFSMDCSVAGYLTALPALMAIAELWVRQRRVILVEKIYAGIVAALIAAITVADLTLYGYWGFRLDTTPLFYFSTSPAAALASARWWETPLALLATALTGFGIYKLLALVAGKIWVERAGRGATTAVLLLMTALLIIPIRGGLTVSTMNLSRAYFSPNQKLNHAAINPCFSLLYSATHQEDFGKQFRSMEPALAKELTARLNRSFAWQSSDTLTHNIAGELPLVIKGKPNIYLVILESFSSHLLPSLGGEPIAMGLDSLAREGVSFTNLYASSFRTDRALPAILSGFPAQPTMSLMKYVEKTEKLPSIAAALNRAGYRSEYFYGGDINFTNMNAYLVNSGFSHIVSDKDFSLGEKASKWGAPDHALFAKALERAGKGSGKESAGSPRFTVIQTSSSHEPFEVPYTSRFLPDKRRNSFAYTDSCLFAFVDSLRRLPDYGNTLVIMVPDHYGAYPDRPENPLERHRIPLVIAGGALKGANGTVATIGSQTDIAATLLSLLGLDDSDFEFSHNLIGGPTAGGYAFFSEPGLIALVTPTDTVALDTDANRTLILRGSNPVETMDEARAYMQEVYSRIADF